MGKLGKRRGLAVPCRIVTKIVLILSFTARYIDPLFCSFAHWCHMNKLIDIYGDVVDNRK
jgi:hypothetical protein